MNSFIFLIIICCIYYLLNKYFEDWIDNKYHYYFGGFVILYLFILYLFNFEYPFTYKILRNIYDTTNQPLYSFDSINSNAQLFESQYPNFNIKETLLTKQNGRCFACSNFIMKEDLHNCKLKYKISLQNNGGNNIENIGLVCSSCFEFN